MDQYLMVIWGIFEQYGESQSNVGHSYEAIVCIVYGATFDIVYGPIFCVVMKQYFI